jgi:precorrin-4 methylase
MVTGIQRKFSVILLGLTFAAPNWIVRGGRALGDTKEPAKFYLVGVGPGDPDLITLRAIKVIERADVLFCQESSREKLAPYLKGKQVHSGFWRLFPYYGRDPAELKGEDRRQCEEIARKRDEFVAMIRKAVEQGKTVAILDSGDPLIYGPYAWCLEEFEDLDPVVVPGLSCFNAANAALGKGITTSRNTKSVILTAADWPGMTDTITRLSVHRGTMVVFTMRTEFTEFIEKLSVNYPPETPVAIVKYAGYADKEQVIEATLETILQRIGEEELPFEYLIYVGEFLTHRYKQPMAPKPSSPVPGVTNVPLSQKTQVEFLGKNSPTSVP